MGRPRRYATNAARQKAYRERQKARKAPMLPPTTPQIAASAQEAFERPFKPDFKK